MAMTSNQKNSLHRHRSRHCIVLPVLMLSLLIAPNSSPPAVSSFRLGTSYTNNRNRPNGISHHKTTRSSTLHTSMPPSSRSRQPSALSATSSGADANKSQTQFVTNKQCPFAQKAWIALEASQCPYEMREVSLYGSGGKPDWFWKLNPQGTVPVVAVKGGTADGGMDEDLVFADSELILDAVGDGRVNNGGEGGLLLCAELSQEENARVDQWRKLISEQLIPVGKSAVLGGSLPKLRSLLKELDGMVSGSYLVGDKITLADCAAFPFFWRIDQEFGIGGGKSEGEENLRAWLDKCMDTESIKRTIPVQGWWWWW